MFINQKPFIFATHKMSSIYNVLLQKWGASVYFKGIPLKVSLRKAKHELIMLITRDNRVFSHLANVIDV